MKTLNQNTEKRNCQKSYKYGKPNGKLRNKKLTNKRIESKTKYQTQKVNQDQDFQ